VEDQEPVREFVLVPHPQVFLQCCKSSDHCDLLFFDWFFDALLFARHSTLITNGRGIAFYGAVDAHRRLCPSERGYVGPPRPPSARDARRRGHGCVSQRGGPAANRFELVFAGAADHLERDNQRDVQSGKFNGNDWYDAQGTSRVRILNEPRDFWRGKCTRRGSRRICDGGCVRALHRNSRSGSDDRQSRWIRRRYQHDFPRSGRVESGSCGGVSGPRQWAALSSGYFAFDGDGGTISMSTASGSAPQRQGSPTLPSPRETTSRDERKAKLPSSRQKRLWRKIGRLGGRRICPP